MIIDQNIKFISADELSVSLIEEKDKKKVLLTIDDGFLSFYDNAWPILKKREIPFILFVSTEPVGNNGYMNWNQIKEIDKESFAFIGHHSHTHDYLIENSNEDFIKDNPPEKFKDIILDPGLNMFVNSEWNQRGQKD